MNSSDKTIVLPNVRLIIAACLFVLPSGLSAAAQRYVEITAEIEVFSIPETNTYNFSVTSTVGTNEWRIDPSFRETGTTQWFFDGTNVYQNIIAVGKPRAIGERISSEEPPQAITNSSVHVHESRDGCPHGDWRVLVPWLAFSSGAYLRRPDRLVPLPIVSSFRHTPDGFAYSDQTETFDDELGLPRTIGLFASESLFAASVRNGVFRGRPDVELWKRGSTGFKWDLPEGAHRLQYSVTKSTNLLGWNIPLEFEMVMNEHEEGQMLARSGARGRVVSMRTSGPPQSVMSGQNVVDWRVRDPRR